MKIIGLIVAISTAFLLLFAVRDFPDWADPQAPASTHLSPHYITNSIAETSVPNIVTSVLADYRSYDTMFETAVVFAAAMAVYTILRRSKKNNKQSNSEDIVEELPHQTLIVKTVCRLMIPFIQIFALYVIAHGHHSPGGGFQGGVILGSSFILLALSFDVKTVLSRMKEKSNLILLAVGVLLYSGIGALCILLEKNFLDYSALAPILPGADEIIARSHGILGVEIGVAITVMCAMIAIYINLSSNGTYEQGL